MTVEKPPHNWKDSVKTIHQMGSYLKQLKDENPGKNVAPMLLVDYAIDDSTVNKLTKIVEHPVLGNPENAGKLPPRWGLLYELKFLPDEFLIEKMNSGELVETNKYQIWDWRGVKMRRRQPAPPGSHGINKVEVPDGVSLVAYVSAGMQKEKEFGGDCDVEEIAEMLQVGVQTYRMIRSILILARRDNLNPKDRELVNLVIDKINKSRNVRPHYEKVKPLIDKIWGSSTTKVLSKKLSQKRVDGYMDSVAILTEMCRSLYEREQPYLPSDDIDRAILDLTEASKLVRALAENLRRTKSE